MIDWDLPLVASGPFFRWSSQETPIIYIDWFGGFREYGSMYNLFSSLEVEK